MIGKTINKLKVSYPSILRLCFHTTNCDDAKANYAYAIRNIKPMMNPNKVGRGVASL